MVKLVKLRFILTRSVRIDEFHWDLALEEGCQTTCAKPTGTVHGKGTRQGLYHLHGEAARDVSLYPHRHVFIALDSTCQHEGPPVALVPWVDAEDPVNNSQWKLVEMGRKIQASKQRGNLCGPHPGDATSFRGEK